MKSVLGSFLVVGLCLSASPLAEGARARPERRATVYRDNPYVSIGAARLDVQLGPAIQLPAGWTYEDAAAARAGAPDPYHLVKFAGPVGGAARDRLEAHGFKVIGYYPYNAFLVRLAPGRSAAELAGLDGVDWIGRFHPSFKVGRELADLVTGFSKSQAASDPAWGLRFVIGLHEEGQRQAVEARIRATPGVELLPTRGPIRVRLDPQLFAVALQSIAAQPAVAFIEPWDPPTVTNDENVQTSQSGACSLPGPEGPNTTVFAHGITGWDARIAIADTCVDSNEGWFYDAALGTLPAHEPDAPWTSTPPDWGQRKIVEYYDMYSADSTMGCGGTFGCGGVCADHGTHVSGSAAGNCNLDPEGLATSTDPANRHGDNDGMAPGARLIAMDLGNGTLRYLNVDGGDLGELVNVAYVNTCQGADCGIDVLNASWNSATDGYETNARTADHELWDLKNVVVTVSMGNNGVSGFNTVRAPATGKNVIGVGAALACTAHNLDGSSSRGDTSDGRLKPDVVVGGDAVASALNDGDGSTNANGGCQILTLGGTSMAAGTASGMAALVLQYFNDGFYPDGVKDPADALNPSGMLLKAMLLNSAQRMTGSGAEQSGVGWPNMDQGWGFVVLDQALFFAGDNRKLWVHDEPVGVDVSGNSSLSFQRGVASSNEPLKVTLVWYDKEFAGSCGSGVPCLINDLDLTVTDDTTGKSYSVTLVPGTPGHLVPRTVVDADPQAGQTTTDNGPDDRNTTEQIIIPFPTAPANYTFTVTAASTPDGPIPFGIVATGGLSAPCPAPQMPANNTAVDLGICFNNGVQIDWVADPPSWSDLGSGSRFYEVLRSGVPVPSGGCGGLLPYGTTSCVDDSAPNGVPQTYAVRYRSGCGGTVTTAGVVAADEIGPQVDVLPDGQTAVCPGASVVLTAAVDPSGGSYLYQWTENGVELPGESGPALSIAKSTVQTRAFNCRVTDSATGCEVQDAAASLGQWTTDFADVTYDASFNPLPTLTQSCGDGDAVVEPGETWQITTRLTNSGPCGVAQNTRADLALSAGSAVSAAICEATGYYGAIAAGAAVGHTYRFDVDPAATCGADATFDVTNIWWNGGGVAVEQPAFDLQVGQLASGQNQTATQLTDPLNVTNGTAFSSLLPSLTLPTATTAQLDYGLSCHSGPISEIYGSAFTNLTGWTLTGSVVTSSTSPDTCVGGGGSHVHFDGNGTMTRAVSTSGFVDIKIRADYRGGAQYTGAGECFRWWYSIDGGSNWILYKDICGASIPNQTWTCAESFNFPATAHNNSAFRIRFETIGGVKIRMDRLSVEGSAPPCNVVSDVKVELKGPAGGVWTIKAQGAADPPKPVNVAAFYNASQGGPGIWRLSMNETAGGTARIVSGDLAIFSGTPAECDVSPSCACPVVSPGEVSNDPDHLLRVERNGANVDLRFEDLGAPSYNVYVSTAPFTQPFAVAAPAGKKSCALATAVAPGGMRSVTAYDVEGGIASASQVYFILVTAGTGVPPEGGAGYTSTGSPRSLSSPCAN